MAHTVDYYATICDRCGAFRLLPTGVIPTVDDQSYGSCPSTTKERPSCPGTLKFLGSLTFKKIA